MAVLSVSQGANSVYSSIQTVRALRHICTHTSNYYSLHVATSVTTCCHVFSAKVTKKKKTTSLKQHVQLHVQLHVQNLHFDWTSVMSVFAPIRT